ncbi:MAG: ribokinase [Anaerolineales bacterium]|nr:ribokinase [Anaerolineales bacterium]
MTIHKPQIVTLGGLNMDLVVRVPVIPKPGETITGHSFATFPGGKGANQTVALARLGAQVCMIGRVGADSFGETLLNNLRQEGVRTDFVKVDHERATGVALITVEDSGQNNISVAPGANMAVSAEEVIAAFSALEDFDMLVMPLETPMEAILTAARLAREHGARVALNPAPAQPLTSELLQWVDIIIPNEFEAAALTGIETSEETGAHRAALQLHEWTGGSVALTLGERGALLLDDSQTPPQFIYLPAYRVTAVDTTAAGDAFVAGLALGLSEGMPLSKAAQLGSAAGAISVTRHGAQPSLPKRAEVEAFIREHSNQGVAS